MKLNRMWKMFRTACSIDAGTVFKLSPVCYLAKCCDALMCPLIGQNVSSLDLFIFLALFVLNRICTSFKWCIEVGKVDMTIHCIQQGGSSA